MLALEFLSTVFSRYHEETKPRKRPHVTLTFAQSLDAKIAGQNGEQLILSGSESLIMTHWMRTMHDAILVGIGTVLNDDPQLNARHLPPRAPDPDVNGHKNPYHLPRPVILDSHLRLSTNSKLLNNYREGTGRRPWVMCIGRGDDEEWKARRDSLVEAGAGVFEIPSTAEGNLSIPGVLRQLHELEVKSLMVEGGAQVIASFFAADSLSKERAIDTVIMTVAPILVGRGGVDYGLDLQESPCFAHVVTCVMGKDAVIAMTTMSG